MSGGGGGGESTAGTPPGGKLFLELSASENQLTIFIIFNAAPTEAPMGGGTTPGAGGGGGGGAPTGACCDYHEFCCFWAANGQCDSNKPFMTQICQKSCGTCGCSGDGSSCTVKVDPACSGSSVQPGNYSCFLQIFIAMGHWSILSRPRVSREVVAQPALRWRFRGCFREIPPRECRDGS